MMMQQQGNSDPSSKKKAARERARVAIRAQIIELQKPIRESAVNGKPPYLDLAHTLRAIAEATGLSQGEVNQLAGSEIAAFLRPEFEVKDRRVELPSNPGGALTAASYQRVKQDEVLES